MKKTNKDKKDYKYLLAVEPRRRYTNVAIVEFEPKYEPLTKYFKHKFSAKINSLEWIDRSFLARKIKPLRTWTLPRNFLSGAISTRQMNFNFNNSQTFDRNIKISQDFLNVSRDDLDLFLDLWSWIPKVNESKRGLVSEVKEAAKNIEYYNIISDPTFHDKLAIYNIIK